MSSTSQQNKRPSLPKFEPLPPTSLLNRIINRLLAPLFYLVFSIITAIVVAPIYIMIDSFKNGRGKNGGRRVASDESEQYPGQPQRTNNAADLLKAYAKPTMVHKDQKLK